MKLYTPTYYPKFHCIASRCSHSCCIGWEIDLDEDTLRRYAGVSGSLGQELQRNIVREEDGCAHFLLQGKEERCPFLRKDGLCRLILELGEESLSQICTDHPRFRNYFANRVEMGLGLCCEAAAELILLETEPFAIQAQEEAAEETPPEEQEFFAWREEILQCIQKRELPFAKRLAMLAGSTVAEKLQPARWVKAYQELEMLDSAWGDVLAGISEAAAVRPFPRETETMLEQLFCYFAFRHLAGALEDGCYRQRLLFCILSVQMVWAAACALGKSAGKEQLLEAARMYSSEIEYSSENMDQLLFLLEDEAAAP